ncbi:MAG TPA: TadE/TadG family type IV pilus assembly protein [Jatrophihabitantaceae bacterium]|nr:TadE/TadG family type IV pilus assembly protein [Jatrophihabitantaceae bacterium]
MWHRVFSIVHDDRGQSFVEVGLMLPLVALLVLGGLDLGRAYASQLAVQNAARAGAEAKVLGGSCSSGPGNCPAVVTELSRVPGLHPVESACPPAVEQFCVTVTSDSTFVTVTVQYTFQTLFDWRVVPHTAALDRSTKLRTYQ